MNLPDDERARILDEIIAATERPKRQDYQFTRLEYEGHKGCTQAKAQWALDRMVAGGSLLREKAAVDDKMLWVYWRPEDEPQATCD